MLLNALHCSFPPHLLQKKNPFPPAKRTTGKKGIEKNGKIWYKNNEFSLIAFAGAYWGIWGSGDLHRFLFSNKNGCKDIFIFLRSH
jgi:hypothetical protein